MTKRKRGQIVIMGSLAGDLGPVAGSSSLLTPLFSCLSLRSLCRFESSSCEHGFFLAYAA
jgi:hypothetical protein